MTYLIIKILAFIAIALIVGYLLGMAVYRGQVRRLENESNSDVEAAQAQALQLEEELATARVALGSARSDRDRLDAEVKSLQSAVQSADQRVDSAIDRAQALEASLDKERDVLTESDAALRELREEHQKTLTLLEELQQQNAASASDTSARQTELEVLTRDRDTWQSDAQSALRKVAELELRLQDGEARAAVAEEEARALRVQSESYEHRIEDMVVRSNAQTESMAEKDRRIAELETRLANAGQATEIGELPTLNESGFFAYPPAEIDDLKMISGVGPKLEGLLNELGIYQFQQIALMTSSQVDWVNEQLSFKGRIERDNWIKQAALLAGIANNTMGSEQSA